jgi:hypothetical protein
LYFLGFSQLCSTPNASRDKIIKKLHRTAIHIATIGTASKAIVDITVAALGFVTITTIAGSCLAKFSSDYSSQGDFLLIS